MNGVIHGLRVFTRLIDGFNRVVGRSLAWLTLAMVVVTFTVVVLRYGFSIGSIALQESVMYLHSFVFMGAAGYTLLYNNHVRVDIFYNKISDRGRAWVDLLGALFLLLPVFVFIFWVSLDYVGRSWALLEGSPETGGLNFVYVLKTAMPALAVVMILQGLSQIAHNILILAGREEPRQSMAG